MKCAGISYAGRWHGDCPREAVEEVDGRWYCKAHANGRRRRLTNRVRQEQEWAVRQERDAKLRAQATRLTAALGTPVDLEYKLTGHYSGRMVVNADFLEALAVNGALLSAGDGATHDEAPVQG